ncbi:hypothetical protein [Natronomonas gomsonensis]|uniref:hypothetical protein n=1 Tax=Natronomonas gomsonensis TaxID=1046043 RepID=UPI0015C0C10E|nr:hypothetical protein [Natronomonas gomsonensis]
MTLRTSAYLDVFTAEDQFNWLSGAILQTILPKLLSSTERYLDATMALRRADRENSPRPLERWLAENDDVATQSRYQSPFNLACNRDPTVFPEASLLLGLPMDPYPENPLNEETTYDPARAVENDNIVLVTGSISATEDRLDDDSRRLGSRLLIAAICARLWEGAQTASAGRAAFPLVVEGIDEIVTGDGDLYRKLVTKTDTCPLAPVFSGPACRELPEHLRIGIDESVDTRLVVVSSRDYATVSDDESGSISDALLTTSLDAFADYLKRAEEASVAEGALCWLRTDDAGVLVGMDDLDTSMTPVVPVSMPETRQSHTGAAETITASVNRHGEEKTFSLPESEKQARDQYLN